MRDRRICERSHGLATALHAGHSSHKGSPSASVSAGRSRPLAGAPGPARYQRAAAAAALRFLDGEGTFDRAELGWLQRTVDAPPDARKVRSAAGHEVGKPRGLPPSSKRRDQRCEPELVTDHTATSKRPVALPSLGA